VRQAALVSDKTKRVRGVYARRAMQIDDLYLYLYFTPPVSTLRVCFTLNPNLSKNTK